MHTVTNPISGRSCELNDEEFEKYEEAAEAYTCLELLDDIVKGKEEVLAEIVAMHGLKGLMIVTRRLHETRRANVIKFKEICQWFRKHNPDAYYILLD